MLRWSIAGAGVALFAVLLVVLSMVLRDGGDRRGSAGAGGLTASISVEPFLTSDSVSLSWNSRVFAESLAAQLATVRGLEAGVNTGNTPQFTLRGDVTRRDGRLVITTRLGRAEDDQSTVWTATYWRSEPPGSALADDIAGGVAEAVFSALVRLDRTTKSRR